MRFEELMARAAAIEPPVARARWERPAADEHHRYYSLYIDQTPEGDLLATLAEQVRELHDLLGGLTEKQAEFAYAPGKWTIKEVLCHLSDTERVFSHRALSIARQAPDTLPSFEQNDWVPPALSNGRTHAGLVAEWVAVRLALMAMLAGLPEGAPERMGVASGNPISVRALAYIQPGHVRHHLEILRQRYLGAAGWPG